MFWDLEIRQMWPVNCKFHYKSNADTYGLPIRQKTEWTLSKFRRVIEEKIPDIF